MRSIQLEIVDVSRDPTPEMLVRVTFPDGKEVLIRWGLDTASYSPMKRAFEDKFFDSLAEHKTFLPLSSHAIGEKGDPERKFYVHLEKVSGQRHKQIEVECSAFVAGNMKWFQESVFTPAEIAHLVVSDVASPG